MVVCPTRGLGWALNGSSPGSASSTISGTRSRFHGSSTVPIHEPSLGSGSIALIPVYDIPAFRKSTFVSGLWRGIGESAVLGIVQVSVHVNVKSARGQIVALDLRSGLVLGDSYDDRFSKQHVCVAGIFLFLNPGGGL